MHQQKKSISFVYFSLLRTCVLLIQYIPARIHFLFANKTNNPNYSLCSLSIVKSRLLLICQVHTDINVEKEQENKTCFAKMQHLDWGTLQN